MGEFEKVTSGIYLEGLAIDHFRGAIWYSDVIAGGIHGIMWNNPETGACGWLLNEIEGRPVNGINEMVPDGTGGIYFGTNDIENVIRSQPTQGWSAFECYPFGDVPRAFGIAGYGDSSCAFRH